jgi:hypothetical protein
MMRRGMGIGAYESMKAVGIRPVATFVKFLEKV